MKRNITAAVLFIVLIIISGMQLFVLKNATERLTSLIEECKQSVILDTIDSESLSALTEYWQEYYDIVSFLTRSDALEDMSADISRLSSVTDSAEMTGELDSLQTRALMIYDEQVPHPRSVF